MTVELPQLTEWHTSDLTAECLHERQLKHEGFAEGDTGENLAKGNILHPAIEWLLVNIEDWNTVETAKVAGKAASVGVSDLKAKCREEHRPLSEAVARDLAEIEAWSAKLIGHWIGLHRDWLAHCEIVGVETPIRATIDVDGEPSEFASHTDIILRGPDPLGMETGADILQVLDLKWSGDKAKTPDPFWLSRNLQLGMYGYSLKYGAVELDGMWYELDELPLLSILWLPHCLPYTRKGAWGDAGSFRPLDKIIYTTKPKDLAPILEQYRLRVRMARLGIWPKSPAPVRCQLCDVKKACLNMAWDGSGL